MRDRRPSSLWLRVALPIVVVLFAVGSCVYLRLPFRGDLASIEVEIEEAFPDVQQISTATLAKRLEQAKAPGGPRLLLIDNREPEEYAVSRIPGAVNLRTTDAVLRWLENTTPPPAQIIVYCSVGYRSSELAEALIERGIRNVVNVRGSIFRWANEDRPLEDPEGQPVDRVHPYDATWGRLLKPGKGASEEQHQPE